MTDEQKQLKTYLKHLQEVKNYQELRFPDPDSDNVIRGERPNFKVITATILDLLKLITDSDSKIEPKSEKTEFKVEFHKY